MPITYDEDQRLVLLRGLNRMNQEQHQVEKPSTDQLFRELHITGQEKLAIPVLREAKIKLEIADDMHIS